LPKLRKLALPLTLAAFVGCASPDRVPLPEIPTIPVLPDYPAARRTVWLDQGWTPEQRAWYHHASQGTATFGIPYEWFVALERPQLSLLGPAGLLSEPGYLRRFGFIPDARDAAYNPDGLPVGFARGGPKIDPTTGEAWPNPATGQVLHDIGLTCAACHTGQIEHQGTMLLVDGGPAMTDLGKFRGVLALAVGLTDRSPRRFDRFADRVLGPGHTPAAKAALKRQLEGIIARGERLRGLERQVEQASVGEGFGRLDALNRIANEVFALQLHEDRNFAALTAPVAYPHLWDTAWFDWVQYNGSIEQPMVRNAGEALGVRALVNLTNRERTLFASTLPIANLAAMEELLAGRPPHAARRFGGLAAPVWPADLLPPIDPALARQGEGLYRELCQGCHLPPTRTAAFWSEEHWTPANQAGQRYLKLKLIPIELVGTDPAQAEDMARRTVLAPAWLGLAGSTGDGTAAYAFGPALGELVEKVVTTWYDGQTPPVPPEERERMNGYRPNGIRAPLAYKARPLDGIWATPPYLHNGSVPTLHDLLSPVEERPKRVELGSRAFDPVKVGYRTTPITGGFTLDTGRRGNANTGHAFDYGPKGKGVIGRRLSPEERLALVEYLKTL
jgi:hypothetical protein